MNTFFNYVFPCPVNIHCIVSTAQTDISLTYRTFSLNKKKLPAFSEITQVYHNLKILLQVTKSLKRDYILIIDINMALIGRNFAKL